MTVYVPCDSETERFAPGELAPALACFQWDDPRDRLGPRLLTVRGGAVEQIRRLLRDPAVTLVLHNGSYDAAVWCREGLTREVFAAYRAGRILCSWVFERLGEISGRSTRKSLDLATCCKAHGIPAPELKDSGLATEFGQFRNASDVPEPHRSYALGDCIVGKLFERQLKRYGQDVPLRALQRLSYRQFCLQLLSVWGMPTHGDSVTALERDAQRELDALRPLAEAWGFIRPNGTRNMAALRAAVVEAYGEACPRTATGLPQTGEVVLEAADDPRLQAFSEYGSWLKTVANDVPNLRASGMGWVSTRYGLAETLRTTSGGDRKGQRTGLIAMQNLRQAAGVRECIRPAPGSAFYNVDAKGLELCALADVCVTQLGRGGMARYIAEAGDPGIVHTRVGAMLAHESFDSFARRLAAKDELAISQRTRAKNGVFGYMGGMGPKTYVDYIAKLSKGKVKLTVPEAKAIRDAIFAAMPDIQAYLNWVGTTANADGTFDAELEYGITRRGIWYSAAANNRFQARAAAAMGEVVIALCEACYLGGLAPARPCLFVHDELLVEVPERDVHEFEVEFLKLADEATKRIFHAAPVLWDGEATDRYSKKAKRVVGSDGRLRVWSPEKSLAA